MARKGFWTNVDGQMVHVQGDPDMSEETLNALAELVRCATRAIENGTLKKGKGMEQVTQWFDYDEIQQNPETLERVVRTPGAKVVRDFAVKEYYQQRRFVASIGRVGDWAVYSGDPQFTKEEIYRDGVKTSRELGEMVFPELGKRLKWRF